MIRTGQAFPRALLLWFDRVRRDLPWRRSKDAYAILVSEVMLQQTRVETVIPYFERFLARFPSVRALADAPLDEVLAAWAGLGYYRRARLLKRTAEVVAEEHAGTFPRTAAELVNLPGIGRYTAGALASIAFSESTPLVDGNVARVFARLCRLEGDVRERTVEKRLWQIAGELVPKDRPGDFNQALMELGAMVCTPANPHCEACPVAGFCAALEAGDVGRYPAPRRRPATIDVRLANLIVADGDRIGVVRRETGTKMAGLHDLPALELSSESDAPRELATHLLDNYGVAVSEPTCIGKARHTITHHKITIEVHVASRIAASTAGSRSPRDAERSSSRGIAPRADRDGLRFVERRLAGELGLSALATKALRAASG